MDKLIIDNKSDKDMKEVIRKVKSFLYHFEFDDDVIWENEGIMTWEDGSIVSVIENKKSYRIIFDYQEDLDRTK